MATILRTVTSRDENHIFQLLPDSERDKLKNDLKNLSRRRLNLVPAEVTTFYQKYLALAKHFGLCSDFCEELHAIKDLRNAVSHGADYAADDLALQDFFCRLSNIDTWADELRVRSERSVAAA